MGFAGALEITSKIHFKWKPKRQPVSHTRFSDRLIFFYPSGCSSEGSTTSSTACTA